MGQGSENEEASSNPKLSRLMPNIGEPRASKKKIYGHVVQSVMLYAVPGGVLFDPGSDGARLLPGVSCKENGKTGSDATCIHCQKDEDSVEHTL